MLTAKHLAQASCTELTLQKKAVMFLHYTVTENQLHLTYFLSK